MVSTFKKIKVEFNLSLFTKCNHKWIKELNIKRTKYGMCVNIYAQVRTFHGSGGSININIWGSHVFLYNKGNCDSSKQEAH